MAWIESHQSLRAHPKTRRLARRLGVSIPEAIGILHCLWWWSLDYAEDGNLDQFDADDIAAGCEWSGDSEYLVGSLIESGFLDAGPVRVHDWGTYVGRLIEQREGNRQRARESYERRKANNTSTKASADSLRADCAESTGLPTNQQDRTNRTNQTTPTNKATTSASANDEVLSDEVEGRDFLHPFDLFIAVYPRIGNEDATREALRTLVAQGVEPGALVYAARQYAEEVKGDCREAKFIKLAKNFLNEGLWKDYIYISGSGTSYRGTFEDSALYTDDGMAITVYDKWALDDPRYRDRFIAIFG